MKDQINVAPTPQAPDPKRIKKFLLSKSVCKKTETYETFFSKLKNQLNFTDHHINSLQLKIEHLRILGLRNLGFMVPYNGTLLILRCQ